ncbi:MAG: hypothetical protein WKF88_09285 [Ferruginibacter sp.]
MACVFSQVYNSCGCITGYMLPLQDNRDQDITAYPVAVYDVADVFVNGTPTVGHQYAQTPSEYVAIWNSSATNQAVGTLYVGQSPFCFYLVRAVGGTLPAHVLGIQFRYPLLNEDGVTPIRDENGSIIYA